MPTAQRGRVTSVVLWSAAGLLSIALTLLVFFPADWLALLLEKQTGGRLILGDPQGSLWHGSAFIGGAASSIDAVTPLLPGRFGWELSPILLLGRLHLELENPAALRAPVEITGGLSSWQISPSSLTLPAERLAGLGAPLNTLQPSGSMQLGWGALQVTREGQQVDLRGPMKLTLNDIGSRMSPVKPLGSYVVELDWRGAQAGLQLKTVQGALRLAGSGSFKDGRLQFSGTAQAAAGQEDKLANLLNLLGRHRQDGDKNVIALEFK
jgi:general secretion pathway protein N